MQPLVLSGFVWHVTSSTDDVYVLGNKKKSSWCESEHVVQPETLSSRIM